MALVQAVVNGLLIGGIYALISMGLTLIFGVMEIVNFAQGDFLMLGMYVAYFAFVGLHLDPMAAAVLGFAALFVLGALIEIGLVRRVLHGPQISQIFLTVGIAITLQNAALALFGADFQSVRVPYQASALSVGHVQIPVPYLLAFAWSAAVGIALHVFLGRTAFGRAIRAVAVNEAAATLCGVNVRLVRMVTFGIGAGLAGLAGAVILPYAYVFPTIGLQYVVIMFTVAVLGGLGNVTGAMLGGLIVGVTQSLSTLFLPSALENLIVFAIFVGVLMIRPAGILGRANVR
ncbi:MAG: branched-chain amino acid ABC transporter permease [bacterium]|nr:branched-chain amino acid ABC transporter permease [bacterium]